MAEAAMQGATCHQDSNSLREPFGVQHLAQGHIDMEPGIEPPAH